MKINLYYRSAYHRVNVIKQIFHSFIIAVSSYPTLIVEVFLRRRFGERYLNIASILTVFVLLMVPFYLTGQQAAMMPPAYKTGRIIWLLFSVAYLFMALKNYREIQKSGSTFDTERFSYSNGEQFNFWYRLEGRTPLVINYKNIELYYEPLLVFLVGLPLLLIPYTMLVGGLICVLGLIQFLKNQAQYSINRDTIMDKLDEMIVNKNWYNSFVEERPKEETNGFLAMAPKPNSRELRESLTDQIIVETQGQGYEVSI